MEQNTNYIKGKIIKLSDKGWGFITSSEMKFTRIFFHWSGLEQDTLTFPELSVGMHVTFIPIQYQQQGWRAIKIRILPKPKRLQENENEERGRTVPND